MKKFFCIFLLSLMGMVFLSAQSGDIEVRIHQIISTDFPQVKAYVSVINKRTLEPVTSLPSSAFTLLVDGNKIVKDKPRSNIFFHEEEPISYYILLDGSGIMEGEPFSYQRDATKNLINTIRKGKDLLTLYSFNEEITSLFEFKDDQEEMIEAFTDVEFIGSPRLFDGIVQLSRASSKELEISGRNISRRVMLVISDGRNEGSQYSETEFFDTISKYRMPIFTIGMSILGEEYLNLLESIADKTGGKYIYSEDWTDVPVNMRVMQNQIMNCFVLEFKIKEIDGDDDDHQLTITVNDKGSTATAYQQFYAPDNPAPWWVILLIIIIILLVAAGLVVLIIISRKNTRAMLGISNRRCPVCKRRMKDDWDECLFCKYLPPKKKED